MTLGFWHGKCNSDNTSITQSGLKVTHSAISFGVGALKVCQMKTNQLLLEERNKHIPQGPFNTHPIFVEKAKGAIITDVEGKEYIDFAGGIGVANVGHCNDEVVEAIQDQIQKYMHTFFHVVMYEPWKSVV